jgi:tRNA (uracil-5-)-methyltransferase TRM9
MDDIKQPWPGITQFLETLPAGSLGLDAGCGNGKYLGLRSVLQAGQSQSQTDQGTSSQPSSSKAKGKGKALPADSIPETDESHSKVTQPGAVLTIGLDYSTNLIKIAKGRSHEVLVGDAIDMPWREGTFDFAISIATIHHFTTPSRRIAAVRTMLRALNKRHGKLIIQVWAVEQVPPQEQNKDSNSTPHKPYLKRQRDMDKLESAITTLQSLNLSQAEKQEVFVPWKLQPAQQADRGNPDLAGAEGTATEPVYQRYYHLFKAGELRDMVQEAARLELSESLFQSLKIDEDETWESGNWSIVARFE